MLWNKVVLFSSLIYFAQSWPTLALEGAQKTKPRPEPRLLLFLTIDQARSDYLVRFRPSFKGGLKLLLEEGVSWSNAHQNHAATSTGPGHATLATGAYPSHSGIIDNGWFDRSTGQPMYCVEDCSSPILSWESTADENAVDSCTGRSPKNLLVSTLGDWIKEQNPRAKVFSVSRKDRAAILSAGHRADAALWFDTSKGYFVSSHYYLSSYPEWMKRLHEQEIPASYFGQAWEPIAVKTSLLRSMGIEKVDSGFFRRGFPHWLGRVSFIPESSYYRVFSATPWMDLYLIQFAQTLIQNESLGVDDNLDFLALSFSVLDSVGHRYGPNSREVLDVLLRLDQALGEFFAFLDRYIGMKHVVVSLSSDHGVMPLPEYRTMKGQPGGRVTLQDILCVQSVGKKLENKFGADDWFWADRYFNYETIGCRNVLRQDVENELARQIQQCPSVARVWTRTQLEAPAADPDQYFNLFLNSFHSRRSPDVFIQFKKFYIPGLTGGTSHGSPYDYDTRVPLLILYPGFPGKKVSERIETVDLAPTLAKLLHIDIPDTVDGIDRSAVLR